MIATPIARRALDLYHDGLKRYQASLVIALSDAARLARTGNPVMRTLAHWRLRYLGRKVRQTITELDEGEQDSYISQQRLGG